jgi:c-di-GMP-related signal transduction protein
VQLGVQLLTIANSVAPGLAQKITSFEHAVMYVGRRQLRRWMLLMLYASRVDEGKAGPAIELAAVRGRLLELLAPLLPSTSARDLEDKDGAFLAGMLSFGDATLGAKLSDVIAELRVEPGVGAAILQRRGSLGQLLDVDWPRRRERDAHRPQARKRSRTFQRPGSAVELSVTRGATRGGKTRHVFRSAREAPRVRDARAFERGRSTNAAATDRRGVAASS